MQPIIYFKFILFVNKNYYSSCFKCITDANRCTECSGSNYLNLLNNTCAPSCPTNYYSNNIFNQLIINNYIINSEENLNFSFDERFHQFKKMNRKLIFLTIINRQNCQNPKILSSNFLI